MMFRIQGLSPLKIKVISSFMMLFLRILLRLWREAQAYNLPKPSWFSTGERRRSTP
jgi:hypothetical protein